MNYLKSFFISNFMMFAMGVMMYSGWQIYQGGNIVAWGGALMTTAPILMMISYLMMLQNQARTSARFPLFGVLGIAGAGASIWAWTAQSASGVAPILAVSGLIGFLIYAYWYSSFGRKNSRALVTGAELPAFTLKTVNGTNISSAELTDCPAILMFYRGNWCPLCMAQIKELVAHYKEISSMGVRVALISPQPHKNTISLAKKLGVDFEFLTDQGSKAARALGIANPGGLPFGMQMFGYATETVLPTVIITGTNGRVLWTDETDNYRVRPEPEVFLGVLRKYGVGVA